MKTKKCLITAWIFILVGLSNITLASNKEASLNLRVLQFNVWQEGTVIKDGFKAIITTIIETKPAIVLFSEVRNYHKKSFILRVRKALKEKGLTYYGNFVSGVDVGIISTYKIERDQAIHCLDDDKGSIVKSIIAVGKHKIAVYSGHLDYKNYACYLPRGYSGTTWQKLEAPVKDVKQILENNRASDRDDEIKTFITDAQQEMQQGAMVIFGGDFNEPSHLDWNEASKHKYDHQGLVIPWDGSLLLSKAGFIDSYRKVYPNNSTHPGFTIPADNPAIGVNKLTWVPTADERERIDCIYYAPHPQLKVVGSQIVGPSGTICKSQRVKNKYEDSFFIPSCVWPSDHKALMTTFKLKGSGISSPLQ